MGVAEGHAGADVDIGAPSTEEGRRLWEGGAV